MESVAQYCPIIVQILLKFLTLTSDCVCGIPSNPPFPCWEAEGITTFKFVGLRSFLIGDGELFGDGECGGSGELEGWYPFCEGTSNILKKNTMFKKLGNLVVYN